MKTSITLQDNKVRIEFSNEPPAETIEFLYQAGFHTANERKWWIKRYNIEQHVLDNVIRYIAEKGAVSLEGLGSPYIPADATCPVMDIEVPDSMEYETHIAIRKIAHEVGNLHDYVADKLRFNRFQMCRALAAEQVDAVAMCIYNIENRNLGTIIGDQTGIGKGRVAAAIIRYAVLSGHKPVFLTEKNNLFTDMYRDLNDIGSGDFVPFIVNARGKETNVADEDGNVIYQAPPKDKQSKIMRGASTQADLTEHDYIMATYSQFNNPRYTTKREFLEKMANDNIFILDESHNASGEQSQTNQYFIDVLEKSQGVVFLSATFAKRAGNMPIYATKTSISEANMDRDALVNAIQKGGFALQEILSSQLVAEGQMIRRQRDPGNVTVNWMEISEKKAEHSAIADNITAIARDIMRFEKGHITPYLKVLDKQMEAGNKIAESKGRKKLGIVNTPWASKLFNLISQLLFSIKSLTVAEHAIQRLSEGKAVIIAFSNTMESFLEDLINETSEMTEQGQIIYTDFSMVMERALRSVMTYKVQLPNGQKEDRVIDPEDLPPAAKMMYDELFMKIKENTSGINISPIDVLRNTIEQAGYTVEEITGRSKQIDTSSSRKGYGLVEKRRKQPKQDIYRRFNDNETDCILLNLSGATGASAQAKSTPKVPASEVKQRCMIILQPELDINKEIQKRGRVNRTGQIYPPVYDYVMSSIPAEKRLMMMLKRKLKSLDANTSSSQRASEKMLEMEDFFNYVGDKVVLEYLKQPDNQEMNLMMGDPLKIESSDDPIKQSAAHKASGRVAILPVELQEKFYSEVAEKYANEIEYLKQIDRYDLEVETQDYEADTKEMKVFVAGKGGQSLFGMDTILEEAECNVLRKPFTKEELVNLLKESLDGKTPQQVQDEIISELNNNISIRKKQVEQYHNERFKLLAEKIKSEKNYKKLDNENDKKEYYEQRIQSLKEKTNEAIDRAQKDLDGSEELLTKMFRFFYIGRPVEYPDINYEETGSSVRGVFVGYHIDRNKPNPFAPSSLRFKFAISDSTKYLPLLFSGEQGRVVRDIYSASMGVSGLKGLAGDPQIRKVDNDMMGKVVAVTSEYNKEFIAEARKMGGFWNRSTKEWIFPADKEQQVRKALIDVYGTDGDAKAKKVSVKLYLDKLNYDVAQQQTINLFGKQILHSWNPYTPTVAGDDVTIINGRLIKSNRQNYPAWEPGTILRIDDVYETKLEDNIKDAYEVIKDISSLSEEDIFNSETILNWEEYTRKSSVNRNMRKIITGNILQAYADDSVENGKLIDFTTLDGGSRKGLILPENWTQDGKGKGGDKVTVPVAKAIKVIKGLSYDSSVISKEGLTFTRTGNGIMLIMPAKGIFGSIFKDAELITIIGSEFNRSSGNMVVTIPDQKLEKALQYLQDKYSINVQVSRSMFNEWVGHKIKIVRGTDESEIAARKKYESDKAAFKNRERLFEDNEEKPDPPDTTDKPSIDKLKLLKMQAQAMELLQKQIDIDMKLKKKQKAA